MLTQHVAGTIVVAAGIAFFSVMYELKINSRFSIVLESGYGNSFLYFHPNYIVDGKLRWSLAEYIFC
jgi:predicted GTPase